MRLPFRSHRTRTAAPRAAHRALPAVVRIPTRADLRTGGFTIAELLLALALVGLLTLTVVAGVGVAVNAYTEIRQVTEADAVLTGAVTAVTDELRFAANIEELGTTPGSASAPASNIPDGSPAYAFDSATRSYRLFLGNGAASSGSTSPGAISLNGIIDTGLPGSVPTVQSAPLPLADTGAGGSAQSVANTTTYTASLTSLRWNEATGIWTFEIQATNGTHTASTGTIAVRAVNG